MKHRRRYKYQVFLAIFTLFIITVSMGSSVAASPADYSNYSNRIVSWLVVIVCFIPYVYWFFFAKQKTLKLEEENTAATRQQLFARSKGVIEKFLQIAERKVAVLDDYGDESWEDLQPEILRCLEKIAEREGAMIDFDLARKSIQKGIPCHLSSEIPEDYRWMAKVLRNSFEQHHQAVLTKQVDISCLAELSGIEFETWVQRLLKNNGFEDVSGTPATGDQGADVIARKNGRTIIIQAKRYEGVVGNKAVQEVIAAQLYYSGDEGWVITNSTFSSSAKDLARKSNVRLIDGHDLKHFNAALLQ